MPLAHVPASLIEHHYGTAHWRGVERPAPMPDGLAVDRVIVPCDAAMPDARALSLTLAALRTFAVAPLH